MLDDWSLPQIADDPVTGGFWPDVGPVRKLAAEMTALALTDAGLREVAGTCRTGLIIASSVPGLGDQVREEFGFAARGPFPRSAQPMTSTATRLDRVRLTRSTVSSALPLSITTRDDE